MPNVLHGHRLMENNTLSTEQYLKMTFQTVKSSMCGMVCLLGEKNTIHTVFLVYTTTIQSINKCQTYSTH